MAGKDTAVDVRTLMLTVTTTATEDGVTTVYAAKSTDTPASWESTDLDEVIEWSRGFLGTRMV